MDHESIKHHIYIETKYMNTKKPHITKYLTCMNTYLLKNSSLLTHNIECLTTIYKIIIEI